MKNDVAFVNIGDEILLGSIADANLQTLAKELDKIGRYVHEVRIVGDNAHLIISTIKELSRKYNVVFTSGGIGPTHDDITTMCVAEAFNTHLTLNLEAKQSIKEALQKKNYKYLSQHEKMALIPEGATLIQNDISGAPGFKIANVYVMAGVPEIFKNMVQNIVKTMVLGSKLHTKTIYTHIPETKIATKLALIANLHLNASIGIYPHPNKTYKTEIVIKSFEIETVENCYEEIVEMLKEL